MSDNTSSYSSSWFSKFFESLYACIIISIVFFSLVNIVLSKLFSTVNFDYWENLLISYDGLLAITVIAIAYATWWHIKEKKGSVNSVRMHHCLQTALCFYLAYEISVYGFAKILRTQFMPMYSRNDIPVGNLSGFDLTWNYFSHSYTFACILGAIQIGGAMLLLFKRTRLLGAFILLPVMVNIVFINVFYDIAVGAFINSVIFTVGLTYLLLLEWKAIKALFFPERERPKIAGRDVLATLLKALTIAAAFGTIYSYVITEGKASAFTGKWVLKEFKKNGKIVPDTNWQQNPGSWSNIYFEERGYVEMCANPYVYDENAATTATYTYDSKSRQLVITYTGIFKTQNRETFKISNYNGKKMQWNGIYYNDTLQYKLVKAN